jgi:NAD(P)-dependent dehydrogenase (short-subunit alcohol dehydrogenase family)
VTVNAVLPGPTWTEGLDGYVGEMARNNGIDDAEMERLVFTVGRPTSLLQRFATPDEVAHMIVYLASSLASATNGAALWVEGGVLRSIV